MRYLVVLIACLFIAGCASTFTIGEEEFACKGNAVGGVCGDPVGIYKVKEELLAQYDKDKGKDKDKAKKVESETTSDSKIYQDAFGSIPVPVRKTEEVRRVYIYPFQNSKGDYVMGFFVFTVVNKGQWIMPDGKVVENAQEPAK